MPTNQNQADLKTLIAAIARSPIVFAPRQASRRLPHSFDEVDIAILDWIAAEARRAGHTLPRF